MRRIAALLLAAVIALVLMAGCTQVGPVATPAPPTKTPKPTFTPTVDASPTLEVFPTATPLPETPTPEATATPEETATPTPLPIPQLTALRNVNIRSGPGTNYARIGTLSGGQTEDVTGTNAAGDWYQFDYNGRAGWVSTDLVSLSGSSEAVAVAENIPAPPPTARPQPAPDQPACPATRPRLHHSRSNRRRRRHPIHGCTSRAVPAARRIAAPRTSRGKFRILTVRRRMASVFTWTTTAHAR